MAPEDNLTPNSGSGDTVDMGVRAREIEVPGIITDEYGHSWTKPLDDDASEDTVTSPLWWRNKDKLDKQGFYCYFEKEDGLQAALARGFVSVSREEAGMALVIGKGTEEFGTVDQSAQAPFQVGNMYLLKAPKFIEERIAAARHREAKAKIAPILAAKPRTNLDGQGNVVREDEHSVTVSATRTSRTAGA